MVVTARRKKFEWNPLKVIAGSEKETFEKLKRDYQDDLARIQGGKGVDTFRQIGDVAGFALNPVGALFENYLVQPGAGALTRATASLGPARQNPRLAWDKGPRIVPGEEMTPEQTREMWAETLRTGLSVAGPKLTPKAGAAESSPVFTKAGDTLRERAAVFKDVDVRPSYATVGSPLQRSAAVFTARGPLAFQARANLAGQVEDVAQAAQKTARSIGEPTAPVFAGETIQSGIKGYVGDVTKPSSFKGRIEGMYEKAFEPIALGEAKLVDTLRQRHENEVAQIMNAHGDTVRDIDAMHARSIVQAEKEAELKSAAGAGAFSPAPIEKPIYPPEPSLPPAPYALSLPNTTSKLQEVSGRINSPALANIIADKKPLSILQALQEAPSEVRFNDLRQLRTWVRGAQNNPELVLGVGQGNLQALEKSLTSDIYLNAERFGSKADLRRLQLTDAAYRKGVTNIQNVLQPFVDQKSGESAFARLATKAGSGKTADVRAVNSVKRALAPEEWNDVLASVLSEAGHATAGTNRTFSPSKYADWFEKLPNESRNILFGKPGSTLRDQLEKLNKVAFDVGAVESIAKPVGGAGSLQAASSALAISGAVATLNVPLLLQVLSGLAGEAAVGAVFTSPKALRFLNRIGDAKDQAALLRVAAALRNAAKTDRELWQLSQSADKLLTGKTPTPVMGGEDANDETSTNFEGYPAVSLSDEAGPGPEQEAEPTASDEQEPSSKPDNPGARISPPETKAFVSGLSPQEAKALAIVAEASPNIAEMRGVGHVLENRAMNPNRYGNDIYSILTDGEFDSFNTAPDRLQELRNSDRFKRALSIVANIESGKDADPTKGATHFLAPALMKQKGYKDPAWKKGLTGVPIGASLFFKVD